MKVDDYLTKFNIPRDQGLDFKEKEFQQMLSPEDRKVLKDRAVKLAMEELHPDDKTEYVEFTEFSVGSDRYGIENLFISEVFSLKQITRLPGIPAHIFGILNLRGKILAVVDTRVLFELSGISGEKNSKVIVLRDDRMIFGVLADTIIGVRRSPFRELQSQLPTLTHVRGEYLKGVTRDGMALLDGEKILNDGRLMVDDGG